MKLHKFDTVSAFVAVDLADAEAASGPVRWARKVLQGGAKDLARSQTYTYAALQMRRSGASAGISAEAADRAGAVAAFVAEAAGMVADATYLPDAAKGVSASDLAPLRINDPRNPERLDAFGDACNGLSAVVAAECALGDLDGVTAVVEGLSATSAALVTEIAERGARIVGVSSTEGSLILDAGFSATELAEAWSAHGSAALSALAGGRDQLGTSEDLWAVPADAVFAGSKMGVVHHGVAAQLECKTLVPCGRLAFTSKALAVCRRRGILALPDFLSLAGSTIAAWSSTDKSDEAVRTDVTATVGTLMSEALKHDGGPLLGACYAAEAFLSTWRNELPFGRPLAS